MSDLFTSSHGKSKQVKSNLTDTSDEDLARHWTLSELDLKLINECRGEDNKRRFALQLCTLRAHGRFLTDYEVTPIRILNHLSTQLGLNPLLFIESPNRAATESKHQKTIRECLGFQLFSSVPRENMCQWIYEQTIDGCLPADIRMRLEETLRSARIVLPGSSTLDDLVGSAHSEAQKEIFDKTAGLLPANLRQAIDDLLKVPEGSQRSDLFRLKEYPPEATTEVILSYIEKYKLLDSMNVPTIDLSGIGPDLVKHLARQARGYNVWQMRRLSPPAKRYGLAAAFLTETYKTVLDHTLDMHDQYMTTMCRRARHSYEAKHRAMRSRAKSGMDRLLEVIELLVDSDCEPSRISEVLSAQINKNRLKEAVADCRAFKRLEERGYIDELMGRYSWLRRYLPAFCTLPFQAEPGGNDLLTAIRVINEVNISELKEMPTDTPTSFVTPAFKPYIFDLKGKIIRRVWEVSLALAIRDSLRSGDLFISGSRRHVSFWNLVYNQERWQKERKSAYATLGLPESSETALARLSEEFDTVATKLNGDLADNKFVTLRDGQLRLCRAEAVGEGEQVTHLRQLIETSLPKIRIERLLADIDQVTRFSKELRPLGDYEPRGENIHQVLMASVIAHGTNLGIAGMGHSAEGISADMLQHASHWFLRDSTLKAANTCLVDYHSQMPLSSAWGDGTASSSDGQRFGLQRSSLVGAVYPRYFGFYDRAISIYTHSSRFSVFSTQVISCSEREAPYVLNGLLDHDTLLRPHSHSTDTHGYTEHIFGLCYLLGFSFMPRIRNLHQQQLYKLDRSKTYGQLEGLFKGTVDVELIKEQWDQLVRLIASLKNRTAPASVIVRRLVNSSDRLAKALTALSRVVKTAYILRYVNDENLRRFVQLQLNRGESRHELARWIFFANQGEFRTGDYAEIMNKATCLSLLSNAILVWNTREIARIVDHLKVGGTVVNNDDLAKITPLLHKHVIPNGTYHFRAA